MKRSYLFLIMWTLLLFAFSSIGYAQNDPMRPEMKALGSVDLSKYFTHEDNLKVLGDYAYVLGSVIDEHRSETGSGKVRDISSVLVVVNIRDKENPKAESTLAFDKTERVSDYALNGKYVYCLIRKEKEPMKLAIIDAGNPKELKILNSDLVLSAKSGNIIINANKLFIISRIRGILDESSISSYDLSDPLQPKVIHSTFIDGANKKEYPYFNGSVHKIYVDQDFLYVVTDNNILTFRDDGDNIYLTAKTDIQFENDPLISFSDLAPGMDKNVLGYVFLAGSNNLYLEKPKENADGTRYTDLESGVATYAIMNYESNSINLDMLKSLEIPVIPFDVSTDKNIVRIYGPKLDMSSDALCVVDFRKPQEPQIIGTYDTDYIGFLIQVVNNTGYTIKNGKFSIFDVPSGGTGFESIWQKVSNPEKSGEYIKQTVVERKGK